MKRATIADVAKQAQVSPSTISNFLNGKYSNMSDDTRKKIEEAISSLKYTPNISARRLSAKERCGVICLVIPVNIANFFGSFYYPTVLSAVGLASAESDYSILIYTRGGKDSLKEIEYLKGMYGTIADGFILFDLDNEDQYFREFDATNIPYVCVGKLQDYDDYPYIATNHEKAVEDAVSYLANLGHKKISFIGEVGSGVVIQGRQEAYRRAMQDNGLTIEKRYIAVPRQYKDRSQNYTYIKEMLLQDERPTALVTSLTFAPDIEQICELAGIRIPEDLSVVLLDYVAENNLRNSNYTHSLSIADEVARRAFLDLIAHIRDRDKPFESKLLDVELKPGESTLPCK